MKNQSVDPSVKTSDLGTKKPGFSVNLDSAQKATQGTKI